MYHLNFSSILCSFLNTCYTGANMGCTETSSLGTRTQSTASCRSPTMSSSLVARTAMSGPCISSRTGGRFFSLLGFEDFFSPMNRTLFGLIVAL